MSQSLPQLPPGWLPPQPPPQPPTTGQAAAKLAPWMATILGILGALFGGYQWWKQPAITPTVQTTAPADPPQKKSCGKCGSADCGCQAPPAKKIDVQPEVRRIPPPKDRNGLYVFPADSSGYTWRWDSKTASWSTDSPAWGGSADSPVGYNGEKTADPFDKSNEKPAAKAPPAHVVDDRGLWWAVADSTDPDQRSWFSDDQGASWFREKKPALVASAPTTCHCPATGNKDGSQGPNGCLCHEQGLDCKCHKGSGIVYTQLPAVPPTPNVNGVPVQPPVQPMMQQRMVVRSIPFASGGKASTACST